MLSDSPPEKDIQWSENGIVSAYKFIQKFWSMSNNIFNLVKKEKSVHNREIEIFTNQAIDKINIALDKFRYNVIIAVYHEIYSFYKKVSDKNENYENLEINFKKILTLMMPVIPHLTSEFLITCFKENELRWPELNKKYLKTDKSEIVIQVNGKKRNVISLNKGTEQNIVIQKIKEMKLIDKYIENKKIFKTIYVEDRIINFILK